MYAIETRGLTKRFAEQTAVDRLDLTVPQGSVFGFLGPNGAGKTTTLRMLVGLARPTAGEALVLGESIAATGQVVSEAARVSARMYRASTIGCGPPTFWR